VSKFSFTTRPELVGTFGAVASTHWLGSAAGMAILEQGGNAFDAVVAAALVLQVAEPHLNGPLGDAPVLFYSAAEKRVRVLCGQGTAPAAATIAHYRSEGIDVIPGTGLLAAVVPGVFDGWMLLLRDYGTLPLEDIFSRALGYAENGVPLVPNIVGAIDSLRDLFANEWTTSGDLYMPNGNLPRLETLFANKKLAETWARVLAEAKAAGSDRIAQIERAREVWSRGFVADAIDKFSLNTEVMDSSGVRHRGVLAGDDLANWQASFEDSISYEYGNYSVFKTSAWAQSPVFLQQLALLKGMNVNAMDPTGPDFVHAIVESSKLAFADREAWYGDPDFSDVPLGDLLSDEYNDARRDLIGETASLELRPGSPGGRAPELPDYAVGSEEGAGEGDPTTATAPPVRGDTCHIDVTDQFGNMISATPSGGWLQSSPVIPELGFPLGTRGQMFWLKEGLPNSLEPGKRPRTTLTPTMAMRDGEAYLAMGTPGGDQQDQWQLSAFLRHVDHGYNLQEAIDAPSFHSEHFPSSFYPRGSRPGRMVMEGRYENETIEALRRRGHDVEVGPLWSEGRLTAVSRNKGMIKAAANPRGMQGYAVAR
jgi:gamma-glutamyltranspeptidase/glutathione hydrolase